MRIGFIGAGNMASAMIGGMINQGYCEVDQIFVSDVNKEQLQNIHKIHKVFTVSTNEEVAEMADFVFLAVKPFFYEDVINDIRDQITDQKVIISITIGKTLAWFSQEFGRPVKVIRAMPNTPSLVGEGMTGLCPNELVSTMELEQVIAMFEAFGRAEVVKESILDAVVAVSGSSPAYVYLLIEAMADGAVAEGMARELAYQFAAQAVLGSAKMVLETHTHPAILKDAVCSPGGSTIAGVRKLEEAGFRSSVLEAMKVVAEKSRSM